jgi:hypothetical protein
MASWEEPPLPRSFDSVFYGAAGGGEDLPSDDEFNRVSFKSSFEGANNGVNNVFDDGSASNHTITAAGNVTQGSFGPFARPDGEWGVSFDGSGDYVHTPESAYSNTGSFTVEAWVYTTVTDTGTERRQHIIAQQKDNDASRSNFNLHIVYATQIVFVVFSAAGDKSADVSSNTGLSPNTWTHIAGSFDGSNLRLFVNGVLKDTTASTNAPRDTTQPVAVGARTTNDAGTAGTEFFQGYISNARLTKSAVYTSAFTPSTSSLTAITNTSLLTCQSNRFVDNSASGHTVTPVGNTAVSAFGPILTSRVYSAGTNGASGYFDGNGDYLSASTPFGAQNIWTIETWYYPLSYNGSGGLHARIWTEGTSLGASITLITNFNAKKIMLYYNDSERLTSSSVIPLNSWTHIAVVSDGSSLKLYVNGVLNDTYASNLPTENRDFLVATMSSSTGASNSYVSCLRATSTAVYTGNFTLPTAPPTAITGTMLLLNMADGQAIDSAAQNNLTLYGNAKISTGQAKFGDTSMVFDETGDYVTLPTDSFKPFGTGNFTIECFARFATDPNGNGQGLFGLSSGYLNSASRGPAVGANNSNGRWAIYHGTTNLVHGSLVPSQNTWYHVAYVRNSGVTKLYIDGTEILSVSDTTNYTDKHFVFGGWYSTSYLLNGYIDEFRISHMARYTSNFTAPAEPFADKGQ